MRYDCWIDWMDGSAAHSLRRRVFGPTRVEPLSFGVCDVDDRLSVTAGPGAVVVVTLADGATLTIPPSGHLARIAVAGVAAVTLRAA